jgi:glucosamine 6-phosphate synthetase-like amidotransferase/phosphosugar isomerase protein
MFKQTGRISSRLGILRMVEDAVMLIGHCRYATRGNAKDNLNNHPHSADGGWIVHNGTVHDYLIIEHQRGLSRISDCDSEILGRVIEDAEGTLLGRCVEAAQETVSDLAFAGIWARPARLAIVRRGKPVFKRTIEGEGLYFSSCNRALGGKSMINGWAEEHTARGLMRCAEVHDYEFKDEDFENVGEGGFQWE